MNKRKHYDFYLQCMEDRYLPNEKTGEGTGLCGAAHLSQIDKDTLNLFAPTPSDDINLTAAGNSLGWWGYEGEDRWGLQREKMYGFTTLRQTIILFMACIAGEKF